MKKLLSAIAGAGILAMATLTSTPAQAFPVGDDSSAVDDLELILDDPELEVNEELSQIVAAAPQIMSSLDDLGLLENPDALDAFYDQYAYASDSYDSGGWVFSKGGCSVDAKCVIGQIGVVTALQCAGNLDPEAVANCIKAKDEDKFLAAASCTYGTCPAFAGLPSQLFAASTCQNAANPTLAGHLLLNSPANFEENTAQPLQTDLLFKG